MARPPEVEVLVPVHNEAASIAATLREIYAAVAPHAAMRFLICEDGSTDGTVGELARLAAELPMRLSTGAQRKGYARAIIDGFHQVEAPFVFALDGDGQVDPTGFGQGWALRETYDVVLGRRVPRADPWYRRAMSRAFRMIYRALLHIPFSDPSCPFLIVRREALHQILDAAGVLEQGFWWEFVARGHAAGLRIAEMPVHHRPRAAGGTRVYRARAIAGIARSQLLGLLRISRQLRRRRSATPLEANSPQHETRIRSV